MLKPCAELFVELLKSKNLNFQSGVDKDGDSVVEFPYQGKVTKLIFSGTTTNYMSLYLVYERVPDEKYADAVFVCNELNARFKWATFSVDSDKAIIIHDDAILDVNNAADEAFELLLRIIRIGDDVKPIIMKTIYA